MMRLWQNDIWGNIGGSKPVTLFTGTDLTLADGASAFSLASLVNDLFSDQSTKGVRAPAAGDYLCRMNAVIARGGTLAGTSTNQSLAFAFHIDGGAAEVATFTLAEAPADSDSNPSGRSYTLEAQLTLAVNDLVTVQWGFSASQANADLTARTRCISIERVY